MHTAYTIGLSINKDLKLKKRKGRDRQQHEKLYTITKSRKGHVSSASTTITAVFCQYRNTNYISEGVLSQYNKNSELYLVVFLSQKITSTKLNYKIYNKELLIKFYIRY